MSANTNEEEAEQLPGYRYDYRKRRYFRLKPDLPDNNFSISPELSNKPKKRKYDSDKVWIQPTGKFGKTGNVSYSEAFTSTTAARKNLVHKLHLDLARLDALNNIGDAENVSVFDVDSRGDAEFQFVDVALSDTGEPQIALCSEDYLITAAVSGGNLPKLQVPERVKLPVDDIQLLDDMRLSGSSVLASGISSDGDPFLLGRSGGQNSMLHHNGLKRIHCLVTGSSGGYAYICERNSANYHVRSVPPGNHDGVSEDLAIPLPSLPGEPTSMEFCMYQPSSLIIGTSSGEVHLADSRSKAVTHLIEPGCWKELGFEQSCRITRLKSLKSRASFLTTISTAPSPVPKIALWDVRSLKSPAVLFEDTDYPSHQIVGPITLSSNDSLVVSSDPSGVTRFHDMLTGDMLIRIPDLLTDDTLLGHTRSVSNSFFIDAVHRLLVIVRLGKPAKLLLCSF